MDLSTLEERETDEEPEVRTLSDFRNLKSQK